MRTKEDTASKDVKLVFETACDLSDYAYEQARQMVAAKYKELRGDALYPYYLPNGRGLTTLTVGFFDADLAIDLMGKYRNCDVAVSQSMEPDAFSVTLNLFDMKIIAYSPGA